MGKFPHELYAGPVRSNMARVFFKSLSSINFSVFASGFLLLLPSEFYLEDLANEYHIDCFKVKKFKQD